MRADRLSIELRTRTEAPLSLIVIPRDSLESATHQPIDQSPHVLPPVGVPHHRRVDRASRRLGSVSDATRVLRDGSTFTCPHYFLRAV